MLKRWGLGVIVLAAILALAACGGQKTTSNDDGQTALVTTPVGKGDVTRVVNASGKIVPKDRVMVGSEVSGRVLSVGVDFNSVVKAGDILARINPEIFENSVRQLRGRIQSANADVEVQNASINRANINLAQSRIVLKRRTGLFKKEAISQAQLEEAQRSVDIFGADVKLAEARLQSAKAQVSQIEAQLNNALANLSRTIIRSPIDGVIIDRKVDPGQTVQASFSAPELFAIAADLSDIRVEAQIVESDVAGLEKGDRAKFSVDAYPDTSISGVVEQLRFKSKEANNIVTYVAIIAAKNNNGRLMPGMTANLEIITDVKSGVLRIPAQAERFRPTPEQITKWQADEETTAEPPGLNAAIYTRLKRIDLAGDMDSAKIDKIRETMEATTKPMRDIINDPEKSFMRTPMKIRLAEMTRNILKAQLSPVEFSKYNALLASERHIRDAKLWVKSGDKMREVPVRMGLSDGAFVEIISGLDEGDLVVTNIKSAPSVKSKKRGAK